MHSRSKLGVAIALGVILSTTTLGCNKPAPETLVKSHVDLLNALSAEFENQANNPSPAALQESNARIAKIEHDLNASRDAMLKLPPAEFQAAVQTQFLEMKKANFRLRQAKDAKNKAAKQ